MKLIVLSDSHGDTDTIDAIRRRETGADAIFHCGDSELSVSDEHLAGIRIVQGNCDWGAAFDERVLTDVNETRILMVHGHQHGVKQSLMQLKYAAEETGANIVLFGHSHLYGAELQDSVMYVNPGSTKLPRGGHRAATYAVIETGESITVTFLDPLTGSHIEDANFTIR
ncbi:phosphoesterase [Sporosarcina sp. NCCP-2716]|uniref:metallophosphoesterase n=1 Tax=Sporosarcina sp. NCCP-2716 TaxID=2943679 RepID=UPI00203DEC2B|nr:metallophosphoesterase [Sporosarcina sp. NCCP-2716]GKV68910.1 phosphoesterase [Sporosarcina sp. NCCP-2716]